MRRLLSFPTAHCHRHFRYSSSHSRTVSAAGGLSPLPLLSHRPVVPSPTTSTSWWTHNMATTTTSPATAPSVPSSMRHHYHPHYHTYLASRHNKVLVIMGPTGSGKSKLSVDLVTLFFPFSEIINSDKIQVHRGLNITTNKIPMPERRGVPHHLLGDFEPSPSHPDFSPSDYRSVAGNTISRIVSRHHLPIIVGGSNSFIYALLAKDFNPELDVFDESIPPNPVCKELRYKCCFLWMDVSLPVLNEYLDKRVDEMLDSGMFEELGEFFESEGFSDPNSTSPSGIRKAIGVPEFERYFQRHGGRDRGGLSEKAAYEEAVRAIKENTCTLAKRQVEKIRRLRGEGWDLHRIDATEAFRAAMQAESVRASDSSENASEIWGKQVVEPSVNIVKQFLLE